MDLVNCLFHFHSSAPECWHIVLCYLTLDVLKIAFHIACQWSTSKMYVDRVLSDHTLLHAISCIIKNEQSIIKSPSSQFLSGVTYKVQSLVTSFSWPGTLVYHSAMQLQPATDRTWQVHLATFLCGILYRLYRNMILAEINCSTAHSISLLLTVTPSGDNRTVANDSLA